VGLELVVVAAVALGVSRTVWVVPLLVGTILILYAVLVGEPAGVEAAAPDVAIAEGGAGAGGIRGNVFGDNATITVGDEAPRATPLKDRRLVRASVSDLLNIYHEHTQVQADRLAEAYLGGWLTVAGAVHDVVSSGGSDSHRVCIRMAGTDEMIFAEFPEESQQQLLMLRRGEPIEVSGRIASIGGHGVGLEESEFLD
jgi:hypothetical protein